jgi:ArsR family transcriptional regulator, arsenate/arsenite/antimonite-responsive transcriptional repressor
MIIDALAERERCVSVLTKLVGADQSTVSKHLAVLRNAGMVDIRRDGNMSIYRLAIPCVRDLWRCVESVLRQKAKAEQTVIRGSRRPGPTRRLRAA